MSIGIQIVESVLLLQKEGRIAKQVNALVGGTLASLLSATVQDYFYNRYWAV